MENKTLYVCNGCCCGHSEKGYPPVKNELFTALLAEEDLQETVTMEKPYCLGPCRLANVVKIEVSGKLYWFRQINTEADIREIIEFLKTNTIPYGLKKKQVFF